MSPNKRYIGVLTPSAVDCQRGNLVKMRSLGGVLINMTGILMKRENLDMHTGRTPYEHEGRNLGDDANANHQKLGERHGVALTAL